MSVSDSPFGPRKIRGSLASSDAPPAPAPAAETAASPFGPRRVGGGAATQQPAAASPGAGSSSSSLANSSSSPFGPRKIGSGGGVTPSATAPSAPVAQPKKKPAPTAADATAVQRLLRWRQAKLVHVAIQRARYFSALELIQEEYRDYLGRTKSTDYRRELRQWRNNKEKIAIAEQRQLGLDAKDAGSAISQEEQQAWRMILAAASQVKRQVIQISEAGRRAQITSDEAVARRTVMTSLPADMPPELRPGSIEMEEFLRRSHITQYYLAASRPIFANALRLHAYCLGRVQDDNRLNIVREETSARVLLLQRMRQSFCVVRLAEEQLLEQALRQIIAERREQFMRTVQQKYCVSLMGIISGGFGEQSEGGLRQRIVDWEHQYWLDLMNEFESKTFFLTFARCYSDEHLERSGSKDSIERMEERHRRAIYQAFFTVMLARIQGGDDVTDVRSERGSRIAIEFLEERERRRVEALLPASVREVYLPALERKERQTIINEEHRNWRALTIGSPISLLLLRDVSEPFARRSIYKRWCHDTAGLITLKMTFVCAAVERKGRGFLTMWQALEHERLRLAEYLWRVESQEWRTLADNAARRLARFSTAASSGEGRSSRGPSVPLLTAADDLPPFAAKYLLGASSPFLGDSAARSSASMSLPPFLTEDYAQGTADTLSSPKRGAGGSVSRELELKRSVASPNSYRRSQQQQHLASSPSPSRHMPPDFYYSSGAGLAEQHRDPGAYNLSSARNVQREKRNASPSSSVPRSPPTSVILSPVVVRSPQEDYASSRRVVDRKKEQLHHREHGTRGGLAQSSPTQSQLSPGGSSARNNNPGGSLFLAKKELSPSPQRVDTFASAVMKASPALYFFPK